MSAFEARCRAWPLVRECHMLNGEIDFILKCVAPDLSTLSKLPDRGADCKADNVANVKTSLVIRCAKDEPGLPFDVLEARLAEAPEAACEDGPGGQKGGPLRCVRGHTRVAFCKPVCPARLP